MRVALVTIGSLIAGVAFAQAQGSSLSKGDQDFVSHAALANMAEIKLGELGVRKGTSESVRNTAQMMIDDHQKLGEQLKRIATRENFALPSEPDAEQKATYERLSKLSGAEFDSAFLDELKTNHQQAITLFQQEAQSGRNLQLKSFAQTTLPELRHHQEMVTRSMNKM
jgi:putative membrane protein